VSNSSQKLPEYGLGHSQRCSFCIGWPPFWHSGNSQRSPPKFGWHWVQLKIIKNAY